ncbi:MAG: hypothetical protein ACREEM_17660 [Blastocatellia bacterium]
MSNTPYDDAFKDLSDLDPEALLLLLGVIVPGESVTIEKVERELRAAKQIADQPYLVRRGDDARIIHIEAQSRWKHNVPPRLLDYGVYLWLAKEGRYRIESYVLLLTPDGLPQHPVTNYSVDAGSLQLTINFHLICLWQVSAAFVLALGRDELLPFVPLMDSGQTEVMEAADRINRMAEETRRDTLALNLITLGSLRYTADEIISLLGRKSMFQHIIKETPGFKYLTADLVQENRKEAREEALQAAAVTFAHLFRMQAAKRFPSFEIGPELEQIHDPALWEQLFNELEQMPDADTLRRHLAELPRRTNGSSSASSSDRNTKSETKQ